MAERVEALVLQLSADLRRMERAYERARQQTNSATSAIEKRFETMNGRVGRTGELMARGLASAIAAIGLTTAIREAAEYADAWTTAGNRLAAAGVQADRVAAVQQRLVDLSLQTRTALGATVDIYARLTQSTQTLVRTEDDLLRATQVINQAFKAGGAAASEQQAAIMQLGQALGSGVLQGDELRSIRENAPLLARAIAKEFGVTTAELKKLGAEGELTTERVFRGILKAGDEIGATFATTQATVSDAFTNIGTVMTRFIGTLDKAVGGSSTFQQIMAATAKAIDDTTAALQRQVDAQPGQYLSGLALRIQGALDQSEPIVGDYRLSANGPEQQLLKLPPALEQVRDKLMEMQEQAQKTGEAQKLLAVDNLRNLQEELEAYRRTVVERQAAAQAEQKNQAYRGSTWRGLRDEIALLGQELEAMDIMAKALGGQITRARATPASGFLPEASDSPATEAARSTLRRFQTDLEKFKESLVEIAAAKDTDANKSRAVVQAMLDYANATGSAADAQARLGDVAALLTPDDSALLRDQLALLAETQREGDRLYQIFDRLNEGDVEVALELDTSEFDEFLRQADETAIAIGAVDSPEILKLKEDIGQAVKDGFRQGLEDDNWGDALRSILAGAMTSALDESLTEIGNWLADAIVQLGQSSGDSGFWSSLASGIGSFFGGGRATGGPTAPNRGYKVNETGRGEFLFMGSNAGQVLTAAQINGLTAGSGRGSGGLVINAGLTVHGSIDAASWPMVQQAMAAQERRIAQAVPSIVDRQVVDGKRNRRPGYR